MDCGSSLNKSGSSSGLKTSAPRNVALKRKVSLMRKIKIVFVKHQYGIAGVIVALSVIAGMWITLTTPQKNPSQIQVNDIELIELINLEKYGGARPIDLFQNWTLGDVKTSLGNVFWSRALTQVPDCPSTSSTSVVALPNSFDARDEWPSCFYESFPFGNCSSSWATATADMLSNRLCIMNSANFAGIRLSPQEFLSCDSLNKGCSYGALDIALYHAMVHGIPTTICFPYKATTRGVQCSDKCRTETPTKIRSYCKIDNSEGIKREILHHGPVSSIMVLYDDLLVYGGGVYEPLLTARKLFDNDKNPITHGITLLGWGKEAGREYWIVQANFGPQWGENGYGKIARASHAVIEKAVLGGAIAGNSERHSDDQLVEVDHENDENEIFEE